MLGLKFKNLWVAEIFSAALVIGSLASASRANDSSVSASPSGGLIFEKSDSVKMKSEYLYISLDRIVVKYVFKNTSKSDVKTKVGFPLPTIDPVEAEFSFREPHDAEFRVKVNGKSISSDIDIRVLRRNHKAFDSAGHIRRKDIDITTAFNELGLDPFDDNIGQGKVTEKLKSLGVICNDPDDNHEFGCWSTKKTYFWDQIFPAGKEVKIEHMYIPWPGSYNEVTAINPRQSIFIDECMDESFIRAYSKLSGFPLSEYDIGIDEYSGRRAYILKKNADDSLFKKVRGWPPQFSQANIEYILTTGANWSGPIGNFTLEINKGDAALISFCPIPGVRMVRSGHSFVGKARDFIPKSDLSIYLIIPH